MNEMVKKIDSLVRVALNRLNLPEVEFLIEHPAEESHGDYAVNVALALFGKLDKPEHEFKSPRELAEKIVESLQQELPQEIDKVEVAGPGFINFSLNSSFFISKANEVVSLGEGFGRSSRGEGKEVVVEYSSPNIAKPFTVGHLRSTIIGDAVANILEATGFRVYRDNHLGDWGTQFGKLIYAIKTWGDESAISGAENPVRELVKLYVKFHQEAENNPELENEGRAWFTKLEQGDEEARRLWQRCIEWSWAEFNRIYQRLGVKFTENDGLGYGESYFEDKMGPVLAELESKGMLTESEGAKLVFFENDELPPLMVLKKDGSTLYSTRDLATDKFRLEHYGPEIRVINETGNEQSLYFKQIFKTEEMLGWYQPGQRVHIGHGMIRFKDGKMSTRKGNVIWLEEVLNEAVTRAGKLAKDEADGKVNDESLAEIVGIGSIKYNDLKSSPQKEVVFDWDEMLNMQGNSAPYLQYTHARAKSVLAKTGMTAADLEVQDDLDLESEEKSLLIWIDRYPEALVTSADDLSPHHLAIYLFELAQRYNTFYNQHTILGSEKKPVEPEVRQLRLLLTAATAQILKNGLNLLGIQAPEKM